MVMTFDEIEMFFFSTCWKENYQPIIIVMTEDT